MTCTECGKTVTRDEEGLTRKLINRGATQFYCYECLARRFRITVPALRDMAEAFRAAGCTLFT
ncbi:MAG: hypothetical protein K6A68_03460 [Clostridiales bacterium]|nr:hypothetical protein [Clostridia bacterium]MCR4882600.1 hypothetical protein [Clostridiales bacterium]